MVLMKKPLVLGGNGIHDLETLLSWLLDVGELRNIDMKAVFMYVFCPVPLAMINEYGILRKGVKSTLIRKSSGSKVLIGSATLQCLVASSRTWTD